MTRPRLKGLQAPILSLFLLVGIYADKTIFHPPVEDASAYHALIFSVGQGMPYRIGDWVAHDVEAPSSEVSLLRPNLMISREYVNRQTNERASFSIVQCQSTDDMGGHYPPHCYPARGWSLRGARTVEIAVGHLVIPVAIYSLTLESIDRYSELTIYNFFARRGSRLESDRDGLRRASGDRRAKVFGAAQVQVALDSHVSASRKDEIFRTLVAAALPVVQAVQGEVEK